MTTEVENQIIEIDESLFGKKRKYNVGKITRQCWVFGLTQRNTRKVFFTIVNRRTKKVLIPIIQKHVSRGSTIYHDDWAAYKKLEDYGFLHGTVNHSREFVSRQGVCTNTIEGLWGDVKLRLRSMHGVCMDDLQLYLDEYCYRYVNKDSKGSIYWPFLADLALV